MYLNQNIFVKPNLFKVNTPNSNHDVVIKGPIDNWFTENVLKSVSNTSCLNQNTFMNLDLYL